MSAIAIRGLRKSFGAVGVLDGLDLDVPDGAFMAVLGASGCGKSTLLRLVAGFEQADAGTIAIGGAVVDDADHQLAPEHRRVGYVPQEGALFPHLDVRANIAFGLPRAQRGGPRVAELVEIVGIAGLERRRPHELSGGQQQRVAVARALAMRPEIVLLDEPFAALDPELRAATRADVRAALRALGTTAILVTHDQEEALSSADVVAVLRDGKIAQAGTPRELYGTPADAGLARFLGDANLVPASLMGDSSVAGTGPSEEIVLVRPEDLRLDTGSEAPNAEVVAVEYFGHDALVKLRRDTTSEPFTLVARTLGSQAPSVGDRVFVAMPSTGHALPTS
ncbi:MAG: fbpC1 [Solirubrobacteraceae bacterium]|nr:fbpC1 [Solirubrobacteraceae bacterium]